MIGEMFYFTPWSPIIHPGLGSSYRHVAVQMGPESASGFSAQFRIFSHGHQFSRDYLGILPMTDFERIEPCP